MTVQGGLEFQPARVQFGSETRPLCRPDSSIRAEEDAKSDHGLASGDEWNEADVAQGDRGIPGRDHPQSRRWRLGSGDQIESQRRTWPARSQRRKPRWGACSCTGSRSGPTASGRKSWVCRLAGATPTGVGSSGRCASNRGTPRESSAARRRHCTSRRRGAPGHKASETISTSTARVVRRRRAPGAPGGGCYHGRHGASMAGPRGARFDVCGAGRRVFWRA